MKISKKYQNLLYITVLLVVFAYAAYARYNDITIQGILKGDSFGYLKEAKLWAEGKTPAFHNGKFYRPALYFFQGLAIKTFGYNDYSVKIFNVSADMINIILIFVIFYILTKSRWLMFLAVLLYAFNSTVFYYARSEFAHTLSTSFVLLSFLFYLLYNNYYRYNRFIYKFLLLISGFFVGMAANTHPDLAFFGVGYVICILLSVIINRNKSNPYITFFLNSSVFSIGFLIPYLMGIVAFGFSTVTDVFFTELFLHKHGLLEKGRENLFVLLYSLLTMEGFKAREVRVDIILVLSVLVIWIIDFLKQKKNILINYTPMILIITYLLLYFMIIGVSLRLNYQRLFLPLFPFFLFSCIYWYNKLIKNYLNKMLKMICILAVGVVIVFNFNNKGYSNSQYRPIHDILKNKIDPDNKILIAPASVYSFDSGFQCDLYFWKNAIYLYQMPLDETYSIKTLRDFLGSNRISYIFISKRIDKRLLRTGFTLPHEKYEEWFKRDIAPYSLKNDLDILHALIREDGVLIKETHWGNVYCIYH